MSRYAWLNDLRTSVAREKFFVFTPVNASELEKFELSYGPLPADYREFMEEFGNAKLFLSQLQPAYRVFVMGPPEFAWKQQWGDALEFGWDKIHYAYFVWEEGAFVGNGTVYDVNPAFKTRIAPSFEQWLVRACRRAQRAYSKKEWSALCRPAAPFTEEEQRILEAIPLFEFRQLGVSADGKLRVEITNKSPIELPWLTVGFRWPGGEGGGALATAGIKPGETRVIEKKNLYANVVAADRIELVRPALPTPEDRAYYVELRGVQRRVRGSK